MAVTRRSDRSTCRSTIRDGGVPIGSARALLGWDPTVSPEEGLRWTLAWFAQRRARTRFIPSQAG
ncbi:hypothetical protein C5E45_31195 [Nocardia nova]|uniref:NAD(P)-binding domain-containing protein n=1 Tax=Nocardia nova TaxID=37330 RepID=A0A2S6AGK2_9NOCA|nr:hypothetical protein C5E41_29530 [Nocardia nova]PPJ33875.1 hypothetical protein C5E45_31195 [Nocardia nova]